MNPLGLLIPAAFFACLLLAEALWPRRARKLPRIARWPTNFAMFAINGALGQGIGFLLVLVPAAIWAGHNGFGLLNWLGAPWWIAWPASVIALDFAIWLQHLLTHKVPLFWRVHRVHHTDRDLDATTALRFHPIEIVASTVYQAAWVLILGAPLIAVIAAALWITLNAAFNHSNWKLPPRLDHALRWIIVTPDMHLVHHGTRREEHDRNYGFAISAWDRLFGTYTPYAEGGNAAMTIGLEETLEERPAKLGWTLMLPFR